MNVLLLMLKVQGTIPPEQKNVQEESSPTISLLLGQWHSCVSAAGLPPEFKGLY